MSYDSNNSAIDNDAVPLITIGITCHNAGDTLRRSVESALSQSWSKTEIIIVDDASTDNSNLVLEIIEQAHPDIRVIRHTVNRGYAGALNTIVEAASGELVAIFDDDDSSVSDRLTEQYQRIRQYEARHGCDLVLCYSNRNVVKSGSSLPGDIAMAIGRQAPEPYGPQVADSLFGRPIDPGYVWGMFGSCTMMARRKLFLEVGCFDETFRRCAEWDFAVRAAFLGGHFIAVNKQLITQYKTSSADKTGIIPLKYALQLRTKYKDYLTQHGSYWSSRAMAYARFYGNKGWQIRSLSFLALAYISSPRVFIEKLKWKLGKARFQRI